MVQVEAVAEGETMIAIPVKSRGDNPEIDERFGRAELFCIIDNKVLGFIENNGKEESSGAGGLAVKLLADQNVETVISPHIGPKAMDALKALKIEAYSVGECKTVNEALDNFAAGKLSSQTQAKPGLKRV